MGTYSNPFAKCSPAFDMYTPPLFLKGGILEQKSIQQGTFLSFLIQGKSRNMCCSIVIEAEGKQKTPPFILEFIGREELHLHPFYPTFQLWTMILKQLSFQGTTHQTFLRAHPECVSHPKHELSKYHDKHTALGQKNQTFKIHDHISEVSIFTKFTFLNYQFPQNSYF